jgi:predicted ATPase/DNA-binding winged helix-turn-helix (wHTH) protein/predicted DNA-binding ribbon-helix-helix protein
MLKAAGTKEGRHPDGASATAVPADLPTVSQVLAAGRVALVPGARQLLVDGQPVKIGGRAFDLLQVLWRRRGEVVSARELLEQVWPGRVVEKNNLEVQLSALRRVVGSRVLITVPGRGYSFAAEVGELPGPGDAQLASLGPAGGDGTLSQPPVAAFHRPRGLPRVRPRLIGREPELADLLARLERREQVTTLCGPAGIGKSSLALVAAYQLAGHARWRDGVHWVGLSPLRNDDAVVPAVAQALGVSLPGRWPLLQELATALAPMQVLVLLDNCEHLRNGVAALLALLRAQAPRVQVLATSQQRLNLAGESVLQLPPLTVPMAGDGAAAMDAARSSAVRLFVDRVRAKGSELDDAPMTLHTVSDICRQLDGLPLAIELAAARVPLLGVAGVHQRLTDRLHLLRRPTSDPGTQRRSSLLAAFGWSYSLLSPQAQSVYRRLSVFVGGFTPSMAQQVASATDLDGWAVLDHLDVLLDLHLVASDGAEPPRLRMLETARIHAAACLAEHGEQARLNQRHAHALRSLFANALARRDAGAMDEYDFAGQLLPDVANAMAAIEYAVKADDGDGVCALADAVGAVLFSIGRAQEALRLLLGLRTCVSRAPSVFLQATFWQRLARCGCNGRLPYEQVIDMLQNAARRLAALGAAQRLHECLWMAAESMLDDDRVEPARQQLAEAERLEGSDWHPIFRVRRLRVQAMLCVAEANDAAALDVLADAIAASTAHRLRRWELILRSDRGKVLLRLDRVGEAASTFSQVVLQAQADADRINRADALMGVAQCEAIRGRTNPALQQLRQAAELWLRSGLLLPRGASIAWVLARIGHLEAAAAWLCAVDHHHRQQGQVCREPRFFETERMLPEGLLDRTRSEERLAAQVLMERLS